MDLVDFLVLVIPVNLTLLSLLLSWPLLSLCNLFLNAVLFFSAHCILTSLISAAGLMYFFSSVRSALWSKSTLLFITIFLETNSRCFLPCCSSKPSANPGIHMNRKCWTSFLYCDMQPVEDSNKHLGMTS